MQSSPLSLVSVTFANGRFVGVGFRGAILTSSDGIVWVQNTSPTQHSLNAAAYNSALDRFAAVGDSANIYSGEYVTPTVGISNVTVAEGDGPGVSATFTVVLSSATPQTVTVSFAMTDSSAVAGNDYTASMGTVTFPANSTTPQQIIVPISGDTVGEPNEQFFVALSSPTNAILDPQTTVGVGVIEDNDTPAILMSDRAIGEGNAGSVEATFFVQ